MKTIFSILTCLLLVGTAHSQDTTFKQHWCGAHDVYEKHIKEDANFAGNIALLNEDQFLLNVEARRITIPVVVHVVYNDSSQIPSMEEINIQIEGLTSDFNADCYDISNVDDNFTKLVADTKLSFELATIDPDGNSTNGITYTKTDKHYFTINDGVKYSITGGKNNWDSRKYLNVWVCELGDVRGYAQFPGGNKNTDGVVVDYRDFGSYGTYVTEDSVEYDMHCRVLTHEVGHWLGLRHIWGDDFCGNDHIKDTPTQLGPHWACPDEGEVYKTCGSVDLPNNFMDYLGFECMLMFTKHQKKKIWKTLVLFRSQMLKRSNKKLTE